MARETAGKPASSEGQAAGTGGESTAREQASPARVGALAIERLQKDDGRALLLYSRIEGERA